MMSNFFDFFRRLFSKDPSTPSSTEDAPQIAAMEEGQFWAIIEQTTANEADPEKQENALRRALRALTADDVAAFDMAFRRELKRSYSWNLWGAMYVVHGGAGDDSFDYFRFWLISRGQQFFETVLRDPESLVSVLPDEIDECPEFEEFSYVAGSVWEEKTGRDWQEMPFDMAYSTGGMDPTGEEFEEDPEYLEKRYPKLWARFGENPI